ncbi:amidohydrolase [Croceitalea rosinachiae]|uniref:Amidohydrolase n=1 Tax=Croceitalea rosinachiae TaxID=3075596 RepID=A0ABU3A9H1_9FLAO|nr:amidohydrolase [Croceitalea sp. F388]MDT0606540.1 amidohydrolase [Croceitalea sp. F388]
MTKNLNIALVQSHLHWENPEANRALFDAKISQISEEVDLIILPEMFTTGFTMNPKDIDKLEGLKTLEWMQHTAREKNTAITGSLVFQENGKNYNRSFFVRPSGEYEKYDKKHTFTLAGEHKVYQAGTEKLIIDCKGFKICPLICYDLRFPVWARNVEAYDILIYVANWPRPRINAWDALLKARAIENMSYCIGVNRVGLDGLGHQYVGHSAVYDVLGEQLAYSEKEEILYASLSKEHITTNRNKLKFLNDRDSFSLL